MAISARMARSIEASSLLSALIVRAITFARLLVCLERDDHLAATTQPVP
jgi:hypothetical protein